MSAQPYRLGRWSGAWAIAYRDWLRSLTRVNAANNLPATDGFTKRMLLDWEQARKD